jgi:hypothetical protein
MDLLQMQAPRMCRLFRIDYLVERQKHRQVSEYGFAN